MAKKERSQQLLKGAEHLIAADIVLAPIVAKYGVSTIEPHTDYYNQLVGSIIGQQLSVKAAAKIKQRFIDLFDGAYPTPIAILDMDDEKLRSAGLSRPKVGYIKDLASHIAEGKLEVDKLPERTNEAVISELVAVKGIGEWTAHMFLIFSLGRTDVLALGDFGVRSAIKRLYGMSDLPTPEQVTKISEKNKWHPYESLACWYLWRSLDNQPT